jgi:hypothetical protein
MNKEFIPYEQARQLMEIGFDEPCIGCYYSNFKDNINLLFFKEVRNSDRDERIREGFATAPLYQQAFRWFRKKYSILLYKDYGKVPHFTIIQNLIFENPDITYEEAELACLNKLIELVK